MNEPLIERVALALAEWLEGLSSRVAGWAWRRRSARRAAAVDARYGPWEDVGEPAALNPTSGYVCLSTTPVAVREGDDVGLVLTERGMQVRVRRALH